MKKNFIDNQLVTQTQNTLFHNSLIVNELFFLNIWPEYKKVVPLLCSTEKITTHYKF